MKLAIKQINRIYKQINFIKTNLLIIFTGNLNNRKIACKF